MKAFLFLTRVGFLLNLVFLLCMVLRYVPAVSQLLPQAVIALLITAGWVLSLIVNMILAIWWLYIKQTKTVIPALHKVIVFNLVVFIVQLLFYFL
jgi:hypothetical protein